VQYSPRQHIVVIGGGIAGISAAAFLSNHADVTVLDMESSLTYHTTGRSAAIFARAYGSPATRALTRASERFLDNAADGAADGPLLSPRGIVLVAREDQLGALRDERATAMEHGADVRWLGGAELQDVVPAVRPDYAAAGLWEPGAHDIDVAGLHQAFVRILRTNGGTIRTRHPVSGLGRRGGTWQVLVGGETLSADVVVNAAGAWGDMVATSAGVPPIGITPLRRTAFMVKGTPDSARWPMLIDVDSRWYARPDGSQILCSPSDETPSEPCDARPEELDVATAIERINDATILGIRSVQSQWAGLRTFAPDRAPVTGFDPDAERFFWLVGQGGTGIQTAPAAGRLAASLILHGAPPPDLVDEGVDPDALSPARFR
jgi:D-arginine dehydrogenase